jgi:hypothetical protein
VQSAQTGHEFMTWTQVQVIGVAKDDLRPDIIEILGT